MSEIEKMMNMSDEDRTAYVRQKLFDIERKNDKIRLSKAIEQKRLESLKPDLEYLDKVAIETMKVYLKNQHIAHVEVMGGVQWIAKNSYEVAKAMLAEKKKNQKEVLENVSNNTTRN